MVTGDTSGAAPVPVRDAAAHAAHEDGPTLLLPPREQEEPSKPPPSQGAAPPPPSEFYVPKTQVISHDLKASVLAAVDARQRAAPVAPPPVQVQARPPGSMHGLARVLVALGALIFAIGLAMFLTMD